MTKALTVKELDLLEVRELANNNVKAEIRQALVEREELLAKRFSEAREVLDKILEETNKLEFEGEEDERSE